MDCVNHSGVNATAYCQSCGKALCQACVRTGPGGQIFCEPCWMKWSTAADAQRSYVPPPVGGPSPGLAALLGAIPGVGAMYNGQFVKGMVHVVIFAVLVSAAHVYGVFGIFVAAWVFYQMFEAYHTARARRDGDPLPDPLGLNEASSWFTSGGRPPQGPPPSPGAAQGTGQTAGQTANQPPYQNPYQAPYQPPYQSTYQAPPYEPPYTPPGPGMPPIPPFPPVPPMHWRRREPIGAVILIALGVLFLLGQFDWFSWHMFQYFWPLLLIGLGVWMFVRRLQDSQGGTRNNSHGEQK